MFDKNDRNYLTINETYEYENSFLLIHWSSIVIYSTLIGIVIFLLIMWKISQARWLRRYLSRRCGCHEEETNRTEMQPTENIISLEDAIQQIEDRMPGSQATSKATNTTLQNRWLIHEEQLKNFKELQNRVDQEHEILEKPII